MLSCNISCCKLGRALTKSSIYGNLPTEKVSFPSKFSLSFIGRDQGGEEEEEEELGIFIYSPVNPE